MMELIRKKEIIDRNKLIKEEKLKWRYSFSKNKPNYKKSLET